MIRSTRNADRIGSSMVEVPEVAGSSPVRDGGVPNPDPLHIEGRDYFTVPAQKPGLSRGVHLWLVIAVLIVIAGVLFVTQVARGSTDAGSDNRAAELSGMRAVSVANDRYRGRRDVDTPFVLAYLDGTATWYCSSSSTCTRGYGPSDLVAAIDPSLGIRKGALVTVSHAGRSVRVRIVDVCACKGQRLIDLTSGAFRRLAPLSAGVIGITLDTAGPVLPHLPPTDTAP